jgi:hypothetical protein
MASDIAQLGRAGAAGMPRSKSQAQIFLRRHLELVEPQRFEALSRLTAFDSPRVRASLYSSV